MSNVTPGGEEFTGYDYVGDSELDAEEGQTLYTPNGTATLDPGAYVYDGADWQELSVSAHGELSSVGASDHHSRYSDSEAVAAADGTVDADTVDGSHASELGGGITGFSTYTGETSSYSGGSWLALRLGSGSSGFGSANFSCTIDFANGNSHSFSGEGNSWGDVHREPAPATGISFNSNHINGTLVVADLEGV